MDTASCPSAYPPGCRPDRYRHTRPAVNIDVNVSGCVAVRVTYTRFFTACRLRPDSLAMPVLRVVAFSVLIIVCNYVM